MDTVYKVLTKKIVLSTQNEVTIINPFGDIHRDSPNCDVERWQWWITRMKKAHNKNMLYLGMGDYHDFASTSEKLILQNPKLHDDTKFKFDQVVQHENRDFVKEINFMRGQMLGFIDGNHNWIFANGQSSTDDLAERMGTDNLGWLCHYSLKFYQNNKKINSVHIVACHGKAGGKTVGNTLNQVDDLRRLFPMADIYIMAHDHKRGAWPESVLIPFYDKSGEIHIKQKRQFLARSGSFLKSYCNGKSTYLVKSLNRPSDLGAIQLKISFHRDTKITDRWITDIEAVI